MRELDDFDITVQQGGMLIRIESLKLDAKQRRGLQPVAIDAYHDAISQAWEEVRQTPRSIYDLTMYKYDCDERAQRYWAIACSMDTHDEYWHYVMGKHAAWQMIHQAVYAASFGPGWAH